MEQTQYKRFHLLFEKTETSGLIGFNENAYLAPLQCTDTVGQLAHYRQIDVVAESRCFPTFGAA